MMFGFIAAVRAGRRCFSIPLIIKRSNSSYTLIGKSMNMVIPERYCIPLRDWSKTHHVLNLIPTNRLITNLNAGKRYQIDDEESRKMIWTALLRCAFAQLRGMSLKGLFQDDNLAVVKNINILCFKSIVCSSEGSSEGCADGSSEGCAEGSSKGGAEGSTELESLGQFTKFMQLILGYESAGIKDLPGEWHSLFLELKQGPRNTLEEMKVLLYHPAFFSSEEYADLCIHCHRLLRHEMAVRNLPNEADSIIQDIGASFPDLSTVSLCKKNFLLSNFLGIHNPKVMKKKKKKQIGKTKAGKKNIKPLFPVRLAPHGSAAVDVHRIAVIHSIEAQLLNKIGQSGLQSLLAVLCTYTRTEVIQLLRYTFIGYLHRVIKSFVRKTLWHKLDLERRKPIPSLLNL